jgi:hypothetical protein
MGRLGCRHVAGPVEVFALTPYCWLARSSAAGPADLSERVGSATRADSMESGAACRLKQSQGGTAQ